MRVSLHTKIKHRTQCFCTSSFFKSRL